MGNRQIVEKQKPLNSRHGKKLNKVEKYFEVNKDCKIVKITGLPSAK